MLRVFACLAAAALCGLPVSAQSFLSFSTSTLDLTAPAGANPPATAEIQLQNSSSTLVSFAAGANQSWLTVTPTAGTIAGGNTKVTLLLSANPANLIPGQKYVALVTAGLSAGSPALASMTVNFNVTGYSLVAAPQTLSFNVPADDLSSQKLTVSASDSGGYPLAWELKAGPWASASSSDELTTPGDVTVQVDTSGLAEGTVLKGELDLTTSGRPGYVLAVPISVTVNSATTSLSAYPPQLNFYSDNLRVVPAQPLTIFNTAGKVIPFTGKVDSGTGITLSASSGSTPATLQTSVSQQASGIPQTAVITLKTSDGKLPRSLQLVSQGRPYAVNAVPQVADGGGYKTTLSISNLDTVPALVTVRFHKENLSTHTTTLWTPEMEGSASLSDAFIPVGGVLNLTTAGTPGTTSQGWAEIQSTQRVAGTAIFRQSKPDSTFQEAAVPINSGLQQRSLLPFDNTLGARTGIAIANISATETAQIRFAVRDATGKVTTVGRFPDLPPGGHFAMDLATVYPNLTDLSGTLDINATTGYISVLGLRFNVTGSFTSFEAQSFNTKAAGRRSFAQVADGGGYSTAFTLVNNDAVPAQVSIKFWRETTGGNATPWTPTLTLVGGQLQTVDPNAMGIPPGAALTFQTPGTDTTTSSGSAEVTSTQWVTGFAVFRERVSGRPDQEAAVPLAVGSPFQQVLPFDNSGSYATSIALANLSDTTSCELSLTFRAPDGHLLGTGSVLLPVRGHRAFSLQTEYPFLVGQKGSLSIATVSGEPTALGLRFVDTGAYTSLKVQVVQ